MWQGLVTILAFDLVLLFMNVIFEKCITCKSEKNN